MNAGVDNRHNLPNSLGQIEDGLKVNLSDSLEGIIIERLTTRNGFDNATLESIYSLKHRGAISRGRNGCEPTLSPFLSGIIIHFSNGRWVSTDSRDKKLRPHAKMVWENVHGLVPDGYRVHHKNGDPTRCEDDCVDNLMLLTEEWNLKFMPDLALGFNIPESEVTTAYLQVEHLPYEQRFPEVCNLLLRKRVALCPVALSA